MQVGTWKFEPDNESTNRSPITSHISAVRNLTMTIRPARKPRKHSIVEFDGIVASHHRCDMARIYICHRDVAQPLWSLVIGPRLLESFTRPAPGQYDQDG